MQIFTVSSLAKDEATAVSQIRTSLLEKTKDKPQFIQFYFYNCYDVEKLRLEAVNAFPNTKLSGASMSIGAFDKDNILGFPNTTNNSSVKKSRFSVRAQSQENDNFVLFAMAFYDPKGFFGNAICDVDENNNLKISETIREASKGAGRSGVFPDLIIMHYTQELIFKFRKEFEEIMGANNAIIGGACSSSDFGEKGAVFTQDKSSKDCELYLLNFLYLSCEVEIKTRTPCRALNKKARITKVDGKKVLELNYQPAADVICRWEGIDSSDMTINELKGVIERFNNRSFVGFAQPSITNEQLYNVSIIKGITSDRGIDTYYEWSVGDELYLLHSKNENLHDNFLVANNLNYRQILAQLHIMCLSFSHIKDKRIFKEDIVHKVRVQHLVDNYIVYSAGGEIGKDITDSMLLGNYTVATVTFIAKKGGN